MCHCGFLDTNFDIRGRAVVKNFRNHVGFLSAFALLEPDMLDVAFKVELKALRPLVAKKRIEIVRHACQRQRNKTGEKGEVKNVCLRR